MPLNDHMIQLLRPQLAWLGKYLINLYWLSPSSSMTEESSLGYKCVKYFMLNTALYIFHEL